MINVWELPTSLNVGGENWEIETDFRIILKILNVFSSPEYEPDDKWAICLGVLFKGFDIDNPPPNDVIAEMQKEAVEFMNYQMQDDGKRHPVIYDWEQDAPIIIAAVNDALKTEVRAVKYMHWYTFLDGVWKQADSESIWANVLRIRIKLSKHQKLEKYEQEFYKANKQLIDLKKNCAQRSPEEQEALRALFGFKKRQN